MSGGIDLESSGEFASVEKMLATTDTNKFSTYLQTGAADMGGKRGMKQEQSGIIEEQIKGKLNRHQCEQMVIEQREEGRRRREEQGRR